jgi:hypothetical protein
MWVVVKGELSLPGLLRRLASVRNSSGCKEAL